MAKHRLHRGNIAVGADGEGKAVQALAIEHEFGGFGATDCPASVSNRSFTQHWLAFPW